MMRLLIFAVAFLMPLIYAVPVEACRCIGNASCPCLKGNGNRPDPDKVRIEDPDPEPVYNNYRKDRQKKYMEKEAKRRQKAKRQAEERQAELRRQRQAELEQQRQAEGRQAELRRQRQAELQRQRQAEEERQRLEAERRQEEERRQALKAERERIVRNLRMLSSILVPGAKPVSPKRDPVFDHDKADRRQEELLAMLERAAAGRRQVAIDDPQWRNLGKALRRSLELGLYPYDHSIQALKGFDHYLHNGGAPMEVPLSKIIIDPQAIKPLKQTTFKRELGRVPKGVPTRISFYHAYTAISIPNRYSLLGSFALKIEADLTIRNNKFTLTNIEIVGGCDIYDASMQPRRTLQHNITRVLGVVKGTPYIIKLKGRRALPDMEGQIPSALPTTASSPTCVRD